MKLREIREGLKEVATTILLTLLILITVASAWTEHYARATFYLVLLLMITGGQR